MVDGKPKVGGAPSADLLARLREAKPELVELLRGDRCRWCGDRLAWPGPAGIVFADGTAECLRCEAREVGRLLAAGERNVESPDAQGRSGRSDVAGQALIEPKGAWR